MFSWTDDSTDETETTTLHQTYYSDIPNSDSEEDQSTEDLISKLIFLSKLQEGEKIDTQTLSVTSDGWFTTLWRTFIRTSESRDKTFEFIRFTVSRALETIKQLPVKSILRNQLITSTQRSFNGIRKLKVTYRNDRMFSSRLETFIARSEAVLHLLCD